ncbi:GGDEF domain-containing response regulator [Roseateles violae]|uniref:diguanylate cyclase n=1 Tax=Roseateles violae TaxID=3058042 RepID=A0ABT8DYR9_9BURK|nr:diguanylate cyclase [Pelomonas sp. PFR6]MDN3922714.1 diguanylate cyclase [Pelomonas sp. PFR6]
MSAPDQQPAVQETAKVLHVDDHADTLIATKSLLDRPGIEVISAGSAKAALELLRLHDFALALLDVHMPGQGGFELAEAMREDERTREIPIIFLTGLPGDADRTFRGYEAGAVDFLLKPVQPLVLESKVSVFAALYLQRKSLRDQKADLERLLRDKQQMAAELERVHEQAVKAAFTDELTGVPNRRHILQLAQSTLDDPRKQSQPISMAVLDLDHFKNINDTHGHAFGDAVLRHFCDHVLAHLRAGQALGRLGGEEFLLLLPGTGLDDACTAMERVRRTLEPHEGVPFTFSAGIAQARPDESLSSVLDRADVALYRAKGLGRDCIASDWAELR